MTHQNGTAAKHLGIPPLAGLATYAEAARPGYGVDENVELMRRYNYVESRLVEIAAAFMNPTPEWEVKGALSLHMYLDAEHSQAIRERVAELRRPPLHLDKCPDPKLGALMDEALRARNTVELVAGVFGVVRPALLAAYRKHRAGINPVFDHPTHRLLRIAIEEEEQMVGWGAEALKALTSDEESKRAAEAWAAHLTAYLTAAGGIMGLDEVPEGLVLPEARAVGEFVPDIDPKRDWRSREIYNFNYRADDVYNDATADWDERNAALMFKRFHEMDVPEMMASIIIETKGKPWEYYRDMSRQLWDEARHSMMGEVWFEKAGVDWSKYPNHVGFSLYLNKDRTALERHITLYYIEQSLMNGEWGKRNEWVISQTANDPLATYFQDYDWADEVLHAQIGRKWLKPDLGNVKSILEVAGDILRKPRTTMEARAKTTPQVNWWPEFVKDVLGKECTSQVAIANGASAKAEAVSSG